MTRVFKFILGLITIVFGLYSLIIGNNSFSEYRCIKNHSNSAQFIEIQLETLDEIKDSLAIYVVGEKEVLDRHYMYQNRHYITEIEPSETEDKFYICIDKPGEPYSEHDISNKESLLIKSLFFWLFGGLLTVSGIILWIYLIKTRNINRYIPVKKEKVEEQARQYDNPYHNQHRWG